MSIEEKILNDNSCSPYVDKGRGYVEIAFKDGAYWGYEEGRKGMIEKACEWLKEHYAPAGFVDGIFRKAMQNE